MLYITITAILLIQITVLEYWVPTLILYFIYNIYAMCDVSYITCNKIEELTVAERITKS